MKTEKPTTTFGDLGCKGNILQLFDASLGGHRPPFGGVYHSEIDTQRDQEVTRRD